jgi:histidinol phosphatase-like PHP family hydrolase
VVSNGELSVLLRTLAGAEDGHRRRALERASRAAMFWPVEAAELVAAGGDLTDLASVGPWVATRITDLVEAETSVIEADELRRDFLTIAGARRILAEHPGWTDGLRADLQMHTTYSDGSLDLADMVEAASSFGYAFVAITDHSKSLKVARGMDEERLARQGEEIAALNGGGAAGGMRVLRGIEMDVFEDGSGDMDHDALARLDLVLGAFHTKLRETGDRTDRYLAALANPTVHVLAHPRTRKYGRRLGLRADWRRVFAEATRLDKAVEIDASPDRQDLNVELLKLAREEGTRISIGTDAHHPVELGFVELGLAAAAMASIPRERILNFGTVDDVLAWTAALRDRATR